jgi:Tol biopolymer transport system component
MRESSRRGGAASLTVAIATIILPACGGGGSAPPNSPPVFGSLAFSTSENVALHGQLAASDPDGDALSFSQSGAPASGTVTGFTSAGAFVYQPQANFTGSDSFAVQVRDSAGNVASGTVSITVRVDHAPTAANLVLRADGAALASINVLARAQDADNDPLAVTIEQAPLVGTASVNADGSVAITGLPAGFKGLTRFEYRVTDPSGKYAVATAAIFVGADPFRVAFAGDASGNGTPEVYLTDFVSPLAPVTAATQGNLRLQGFAVSDNGATVVYRRADATTRATTDLSFVETANPSSAAVIPLPSGVTPVPDANGKDQYQVSPDGQWIAAVGSSGSSYGLYVLNVSSPAIVTNVAASIQPAILYVTTPRFSVDSKNLYFLAASTPGGANRVLYTVALDNLAAVAQVSASNASASDDVSDYMVAPDQSRILLDAIRSGVGGLYFVDPRQLQTEVLVNQPLSTGQTLVGSTIDLPPGQGGSAAGTQIAYTIRSTLLGLSDQAYVASVSATPNPQAIGPPGADAIAFRPDDAALLYSLSSPTAGMQIYEAAGVTDQLIGNGVSGRYDSTGNIVLLTQYLPSGGTPTTYPVLAVATRGSFGSSQPLGTPGKAATYFNTSGFDRAVVLIGEGPTTGTAPASVRLALVNALAGGNLLYLADFQTPLGLGSDVARVVQ